LHDEPVVLVLVLFEDIQLVGEVPQVQIVLDFEDVDEVVTGTVYLAPAANRLDVVDHLDIPQQVQFPLLLLLHLLLGEVVFLSGGNDLLDLLELLLGLLLEAADVLVPEFFELLVDQFREGELHVVEVGRQEVHLLVLLLHDPLVEHRLKEPLGQHEQLLALGVGPVGVDDAVLLQEVYDERQVLHQHSLNVI
jgi:hypothetical protein